LLKHLNLFNKLKKAIAFLLVFSTFLAKSQQYSFINFGVKEGLAQSQVTDICQDNLGYLWIGTQSGLSRFDGLKFINYSKNDGLVDNTVQKLYFDKNSNLLWVASPTGISILDLTKKIKFNHHTFTTPQKVNDILFDNDTLYIVTNQGLILFSNNKFTYFLNDLRIRAIEKISSNEIVLATKKGLYAFVNQNISKYKDTSLIHFNYSDMLFDEEVLYLSTYQNGILKYDLKNKLLESLSDQKSIVSFIKQKNKIWAISNQTIILYNNKQQKIYTHNNGLPKVKLKRLFIDDEDNLWIGTYGKGLLKFSNESVMSYTVDFGLPSDIILCISQNNKGDFCFGSYDKGLLIFDKNKKHYVDHSNGLPSQTVWSILPYKEAYFIATSTGVCKLDNKQLKTINELRGNYKSIVENENIIFFGGKSGLWIYKNEKFENVNTINNTSINKIVFNKNYIYLATKKGLFYNHITDLYQKEFKTINLPEKDCNTITIDNYDNIWVGTVDGLYVISPSLKTIEYQLDSLNFKSKNILGLLTDSNKNIWISTTNGVYLLIEGNPFSLKMEQYHYTEDEGILDLESNLNAIYEDKLGYIWIGTSSALYRINPNLKNQLFTKETPKLSITSIRLFKEQFDYKKYAKGFYKIGYVPTKLILPPKQNHLTFEFIGINLKKPSSVKYSYRLKGAEENWSPLSTEKTATYSFISPGDYIFQVKATNDGVNWTDIKSVNITIKPFLWQKWWFILLMIIALVSILYFIVKLRLNIVKRKKDNEKLEYKNRLRELEQQSLNASMNRHFIFNSLNSIQYFINSSDKKSANKFLSNFAKLIRKNLDSSTADNFMVNLDEEIERIHLYLSLEKMRFGDKFDFKINVDKDVDVEMTKVPSMILQPFVENSIIHGILPKEDNKGLIQINIKKFNSSLEFEVVDNGVGIDESTDNKSEFAGDHESKGMKITENRIELIRKINGGKLMIIGPFQINDEHGKSKGTKVIIKLPINGIE